MECLVASTEVSVIGLGQNDLSTVRYELSTDLVDSNLKADQDPEAASLEFKNSITRTKGVAASDKAN